MLKKGFDTERYLKIQSEEILNRAKRFKKFYLEVGGKLCHDFHASRVLPGYDPNTKIKLLQKLRNCSEIVLCVSAKDIENSKIEGDFGLTYEAMTLKLVNDLRDFGLNVSAIVINRFSNEKKAIRLKRYFENMDIRAYLQKEIEGYPADVDKIVSEDGYGKNPYVENSKPIVVVTGAGPGSGKMSFCLSQLYFDNLNKRESGYAKFETFPVWDLPLEHPVNIAYEAATADIGDVNMVDPFHLQEYGVTATNYNRDIESFPILKKILERIGQQVYKSPTEMGVNRTKQGIINDEIVREASKQEIIRRYFRYKKENLLGMVGKNVVERVEKLMQKLEINESYREVVSYARQAAFEAEKEEDKGNKGFYCGSAIQIGNKIIIGKNSELLHSESACIIKALKYLANIPANTHLLPENMINSIRTLKQKISGKTTPSLDVSEILIALAVTSSTNPFVLECINKIPLLKNCEMHTTHLPTKGDEVGLRDLRINLTTDAKLTPKIYLRG